MEQSGEQPAHGMVFRKAITSVVNIGRRPASGPDKGDEPIFESDKAMFRCPVISRKHAKIAFADSGQVRLIIVPYCEMEVSLTLPWSRSTSLI